MYTAVLQVIIYQLAKYYKDPMKNGREIAERSGKEIKEEKRKDSTTRIEPVGKPYREVCLQTLLWPWKVRRPSSWSL